jgi:hypothetical protein
MPNLLSTHWIPVHGRPEDLDYHSALNPNVAKSVDADAHRVSQVYNLLGANPIYFLRDWALSEQKEDMRSQPEKTGVRHAEEWNQRVTQQYGFLPRGLVVVSGINEPEVWVDFSVVPYTVAFLDRLAQLGLRGAALNLSVGWPANNGADTPPDWSPYEPVHSAILRGKHFLCLHEYWDERGPEYNWGWWCGRYESCPWNVPIIIGECGLDKYVSDPTVSPERRGWQGWLSADVYANQVGEYVLRCGEDDRIVGCCLYTTDYSHPWASFDTLPAHKYLKDIQYPAPEPRWGFPEEPPITPPVTPPVAPPVDGDTQVTQPVRGFPISQHWGQNGKKYERFGLWGHNGTDFAVPLGTKVHCIADGTVEFAGLDDDYGLYVRVFHPQLNCHSFYAHLNVSAVTVGATAVRGALIGESGNSGNSTGPHLHYEIRLGSRDTYTAGTPMPKGRIDPETWHSMVGCPLV